MQINIPIIQAQVHGTLAIINHSKYLIINYYAPLLFVVTKYVCGVGNITWVVEIFSTKNFTIP